MLCSAVYSSTSPTSSTQLPGRDRPSSYSGKEEQNGRPHTPPVVPLRYLLGFVRVVLPVRQFFAESIKDEIELKRLEAAWTKAVLLHITLCRSRTRKKISGEPSTLVSIDKSACVYYAK